MKNATFKTFNESDIEKLKAIGVDTKGYTGSKSIEFLYHIIDSELFCGNDITHRKVYDTVDDYIASVESEKPSEYPKVMLVRDAESELWRQRVVFMKKCGKFLAWNIAETLKESEKSSGVTVWNHAKDLPTTTKMTLQEVQEKLGIDNLEIV